MINSFMINNYEKTWQWMEDTIDIPDILAEYMYSYMDEYGVVDDFLMHIIWDLWDKYPQQGKLSLDAVADFVSLIL